MVALAVALVKSLRSGAPDARSMTPQGMEVLPPVALDRCHASEGGTLDSGSVLSRSRKLARCTARIDFCLGTRECGSVEDGMHKLRHEARCKSGAGCDTRATVLERFECCTTHP